MAFCLFVRFDNCVCIFYFDFLEQNQQCLCYLHNRIDPASAYTASFYAADVEAPAPMGYVVFIFNIHRWCSIKYKELK